MTNDIYVYIEHENGFIKDVSLELLAKAEELKASRMYHNINIVALVIGSNIAKVANECAYYGADKVIKYANDELIDYHTTNYATVIAEILTQDKPSAFLIGGTALGRDLAPRISAKLQTGLTADATHIEFNPDDESSDQLWITRPAFGGNLFATIICPDKRPQMATIRPNVFTKNEPDTSKVALISDFSLDIPMKKDMKYVKKVTKKMNRVEIEKAKIIVSGGRGVKQDLSLLEETAKSLHGEMAVSRAIVDEGLAPKTIQVGQTGKTVRPVIYLACGISGAVQHTAGMDNSEMIIAINTDENAPIFDVADISIVGNAQAILNEINAKLR